MVCHIAIGARTEASEAYPEVNIGEWWERIREKEKMKALRTPLEPLD
jgi:hypothetical protein